MHLSARDGPSSKIKKWEKDTHYDSKFNDAPYISSICIYKNNNYRLTSAKRQPVLDLWGYAYLPVCQAYKCYQQFHDERKCLKSTARLALENMQDRDKKY